MGEIGETGGRGEMQGKLPRVLAATYCQGSALTGSHGECGTRKHRSPGPPVEVQKVQQYVLSP